MRLAFIANRTCRGASKRRNERTNTDEESRRARARASMLRVSVADIVSHSHTHTRERCLRERARMEEHAVCRVHVCAMTKQS